MVLGFDSYPGLYHTVWFGASIDAMRIVSIKVALLTENTSYRNNYGHCLHGGPNGFQYQVLMPGRLVRRNSSSPIFLRMEKKVFPAISLAKCWWHWRTITLSISAMRQNDQPTIVNMTNHSYFTWMVMPAAPDHLLTIDADYYTPVDSTMTTGETAPVAKHRWFSYGNLWYHTLTVQRTETDIDDHWVLNTKEISPINVLL